MFFDDGSAGGESIDESKGIASVLQDTLKRAGWIANEEKSCWQPSQRPKILGFLLDLVEGKVLVTDRRVEKLVSWLKILRHKSRPNAKELARLVEMLVSMSFAIGPVTRLRTRGIYNMILNRDGWFTRMEWIGTAKSEVEFWWNSFEDFHGTPMVENTSTVAVVSTWSDASDVAWGGFSLACGEIVARGNWPEAVREAGKSSTWRELKATELVLRSLGGHLEGKECRHRTDNQAAARILEFGSKVPELHDIALDIFLLCRQRNIRLVPESVPREQNERADYYSKLVDADDWMLSPQVFKELDNVWGPHTLDGFASHTTKQLHRFCSRWWNPECLAVDAFTLKWEEENVWLSPPFYLIGDAIEKVQQDGCNGTLIVPEWTSAWWWPLLFKDREECRAPVVTWYCLPREENVFMSGTCKWNWFSAECPRCEVLAVRLCAKAGCSKC